MNVYREIQPWGKSEYEVNEGSYTTFQTKLQKVEFITNPQFGRMLFLDGVLQSTTSDEHIYHEALVNAGMTNTSKSVLIAGGAEGAVTREVLKWPSVKFVEMVDWDDELVDHCFFKEEFNTSSFKDPRLSYLNENISKYCEETTKKFDTIFLDLLDINTEEDLYKMQTILSHILNVCAKGRVTIVINIGRYKSHAAHLTPTIVQESEVIEIQVPSFQEPWYLLKLIYST